MIAIAQEFEPFADRDDIALENAALRLSTAFVNDIREFGIDEEKEDFNRLDAAERVRAGQLMGKLASQLSEARRLQPYEKDQILAILSQGFGDRIPNETTWIEPENRITAVRQTPARQVAPPVIPSTQAG
jgi:hypothetical protein